MTELLQPYEVSVVHYNLSEAETLQDTFYSLNRLNETFNDAFNRIEMKLTEEKHKLNSINARISICQTKVELVRGT